MRICKKNVLKIVKIFLELFGAAGFKHCVGGKGSHRCVAVGLWLVHRFSIWYLSGTLQRAECQFWLATPGCIYTFASYFSAQFSTSSAVQTRGFLIFAKQKIIATNNFILLVHRVCVLCVSHVILVPASRKNYEIPDLGELWTDFKDIVKKNLGTHYYKLWKTRVDCEDT